MQGQFKNTSFGNIFRVLALPTQKLTSLANHVNTITRLVNYKFYYQTQNMKEHWEYFLPQNANKSK